MEVGSVVRLKSGGPYMTISAIQHDGKVVRAWCDWFDGPTPMSGNFPVTSLTLAAEDDLD